MGNSQSLSVLPPRSSGAQFGSGQPAVASQQPCLVFGDPSLYSVGIRTSYYLLYVAAFLCILVVPSGCDRDLRLWFLSFVPLAAASLVVLSLNATSGGLVIVDWSIVFGLVFWSILFLIWPVFLRPSRGRADHPGQVGDLGELRQDLERDGGRMVSDQEAEWDAQYAAVLRVLGTDDERAEEEFKGNKQDALERALQDYVTAFAAARFSPASGDAASYISGLYGAGRAREVAAGMAIDNKQVESFRDAHAEALRRAGIPFDQAQATTQTLARVAMKGSPPREASGRRWSPRQVVNAFGARAKTTGLISCGLGLVIYSGYSAFMVWLLFRGIRSGYRDGCNIQFIFFIVPVSCYNRTAITALRTFACIWLALVGVPALLGGSVLFATGVRDWWSGPPLARRGGVAAAKQPSGLTTVPPYDSEKGKETEVTSPATMTRASRGSDLLYEMEEYPRSSPSTVRDTRSSTFPSPEPPKGSSSLGPGVGVGVRGGRAGGRLPAAILDSWAQLRWRWEFLLVLPVIHTIVVVEMTIRINGLDMRQRPMTSMGELLAFFIGAFLLVRVLAGCAHRAAEWLRRRRSAGWVEERWRILSAPASRLEEDQGYGHGGGSGSGGGAVLGKEISVGESSFGKETEVAAAAMGKPKRILYLQPERKSGSSMGKFREMIDEDDAA